MALIRFRRFGNTSDVLINKIRQIPQPENTSFVGVLDVRKGTPISRLATQAFGAGRESMTTVLCSKNVDRLLAYDLSMDFIPTLDVPDEQEY